MRRREITCSDTGETETGPRMEMEWLKAERRERDVLSQAKPGLGGLRAAGKEWFDLESDGDYLK